MKTEYSIFVAALGDIIWKREAVVKPIRFAAAFSFQNDNTAFYKDGISETLFRKFIKESRGILISEESWSHLVISIIL